MKVVADSDTSCCQLWKLLMMTQVAVSCESWWQCCMLSDVKDFDSGTSCQLWKLLTVTQVVSCESCWQWHKLSVVKVVDSDASCQLWKLLTVTQVVSCESCCWQWCKLLLCLLSATNGNVERCSIILVNKHCWNQSNTVCACVFVCVCACVCECVMNVETDPDYQPMLSMENTHTHTNTHNLCMIKPDFSLISTHKCVFISFFLISGSYIPFDEVLELKATIIKTHEHCLTFSA